MEHYEPPTDLLRGRVILITGAADTLGAAVAEACAAHGASVILSDRREEDLEALYDRIEAAGGAMPGILPLDLSAPEEERFLGAVGAIAQTYGRLDGLAHCAAFAPFLSRIDDYDLSEWERVIRINLTGPFLLTQACLPLLRASQDASILFTSDRVGRRGLAYWGAFCAAKFGIEGLMQTLAEETENSSVRVNSLDPGILRTGLRTRLYPGEDPDRLPSAQSVTARYLYLLGPDGRAHRGRAL